MEVKLSFLMRKRKVISAKQSKHFPALKFAKHAGGDYYRACNL